LLMSIPPGWMAISMKKNCAPPALATGCGILSKVAVFADRYCHIGLLKMPGRFAHSHVKRRTVPLGRVCGS
jgi:hypothetical protein